MIEIKRAIALAVVVSSMSAVCLPAAQAEARFTAHEAIVAKHVAWRYWRSLDSEVFKRPSYHCEAGEVSLTWVESLGDAMARTQLWGCRDAPPEIKLEEPTIRGLRDIHACGVITHEYGHLLGHGHVRNRDSVMSGDPGAGERAPRRATWVRAWRRCERKL